MSMNTKDWWKVWKIGRYLINAFFRNKRNGDNK